MFSYGIYKYINLSSSIHLRKFLSESIMLYLNWTKWLKMLYEILNVVKLSRFSEIRKVAIKPTSYYKLLWGTVGSGGWSCYSFSSMIRSYLCQARWFSTRTQSSENYSSRKTRKEIPEKRFNLGKVQNGMRKPYPYFWLTPDHTWIGQKSSSPAKIK